MTLGVFDWSNPSHEASEHQTLLIEGSARGASSPSALPTRAGRTDEALPFRSVGVGIGGVQHACGGNEQRLRLLGDDWEGEPMGWRLWPLLEGGRVVWAVDRP